jgi:hypothetical protein
MEPRKREGKREREILFGAKARGERKREGSESAKRKRRENRYLPVPFSPVPISRFRSLRAFAVPCRLFPAAAAEPGVGTCEAPLAV